MIIANYLSIVRDFGNQGNRNEIYVYYLKCL